MNLGSLAYWDQTVHCDDLRGKPQETVVPVVPIGKMTSDASMLEEYEDIITIELVEDEESLSGTAGTLTENSGEVTENEGAARNETVFTADTKVWDVIHDPVFGDYGRLIFPADRSISDSLTLGDVGNILTWYSYVSPDRTVEIANYLREQAASGRTDFCDIYTEEEKAADPAKEDTGVLFSVERPVKMPLPMRAADLFYVAAMHDSFSFPTRSSCRKGL